MSKLDTFLQEKQQRSEEWKALKTAERDELNAMSDEAIMRTTRDPLAYQQYLDVQAENPRYSASNVLLVMAQNPEVSQFNSLKVWNNLGRTVKRDEEGMKLRVTDPYVRDGKEYRGYKIGRVFDISQTTGKGGVPKLTLRENTPEMDTALRKLLDLSPVKIKTDPASRRDAFYDPNTQEITVSTSLTDTHTFSALAREIALASIHNHGQYPYYSREDCMLDASSVSYMLSRSFGLSAERPNVSNLTSLFEGMEVQDRRGVLDSLQQLFQRMQWDIQREVSPQERKVEHTQPAR